jgi:hypothetical protein
VTDYLILLAPLLAAGAAALRRFTAVYRWPHAPWFPLTAGAGAAILTALADLASTGALTGHSAASASISAVCAALAAWHPEPPPEPLFPQRRPRRRRS